MSNKINQDQTLSMFAPTPPSVTQGSATLVGSPTIGGQAIYYWIVARYPVGLSAPFGPIAVTGTPGVVNLSASRFVRVSWNAVAGVTSYDVIRSTTQTYPVPSATAAVALATTATSFNDVGGGTFAYPPSGIGVANQSNAAFQIDNLSQAAPFVTLTLDNSTNLLPQVSGNPVAGNCAQWAAGGVLVDSGAACGSGGGGGASYSAPYITISPDVIGPINACTVPVGTGFAFVNQGSTVLTDTGTSWNFFVPGEGSSNVSSYVKTLPATPYTITAAFRAVTIDAANNSRLGVGLRESGTAKMVFIANYRGSRTEVVNYTNNTTPTSNPFTQISYPNFVTLWVRIVNDGVNIAYQYSVNNVVWITMFTGVIAAFFTVAPDQYGVFMDHNSGVGNDTLIELVSLVIA